jgi:hypothetical protein
VYIFPLIYYHTSLHTTKAIIVPISHIRASAMLLFLVVGNQRLWRSGSSRFVWMLWIIYGDQNPRSSLPQRYPATTHDLECNPYVTIAVVRRSKLLSERSQFHYLHLDTILQKYPSDSYAERAA